MDEIGFDLAGQYSKGIKEFIGRVEFDYLIPVSDSADQNCPVFPGSGERLQWSFEDPVSFTGSDNRRLAKFRDVCDIIRERILSRVAEQGRAAGIPGLFYIHADR
jgi:arsenate reductase